MASRKSVPKPVTAGRRVGKKRSDMRWLAPDGTEWDSRFEYEVHEKAIQQQVPIRRCVRGRPDAAEGDTFSYWHPGRSGTCKTCGGSDVGTTRSYTPDLLHDRALRKKPDNEADLGAEVERYHVDTKGYIRAAQRSLLRSLCKARADIALRIILQRNFPVSKRLTASDWIRRCLKIPHAIWNGSWPTEWIMPELPKRKKK